MLSKSCQYAIKAMMFVAQKSKEGLYVGVKEIARSIDAPEHYVGKIMQELSRKRLLKSLKGPNGGFYMDVDDLKNPISSIVKAIDGDGIFINCVLGLKVCSEKTPCPVHHPYKEIRKNLITMLEANTIGQFKQKLDSGDYYLKNDTIHEKIKK